MTRSTVTPCRANQARARSRKAVAGFLALVRQDLAVGEPAGVVDADVQALPTDAVMTIDRAWSRPGDPVPDPRDAAEFLGVEMHQLAGTRPLIAHHRDRWIERLQAIEPKPAQDLRHGRDRQIELPRDRRRTGPLPTQSFDSCNDLRGRAARPPWP